MSSSFRIPCQYCGKEFKSGAELSKHHTDRPLFSPDRSHCTTESGCYLCEGEHHRKPTGTPSSNQCTSCNNIFGSSAELRTHNRQKPIRCSTRGACTTEHGCYLCGGGGVHYRKDTGGTWTFGFEGYWTGLDVQTGKLWSKDD